jgi:hypothetical protein
MADDTKLSLQDKKVHKASSDGDAAGLKKLLEKKADARVIKVAMSHHTTRAHHTYVSFAFCETGLTSTSIIQ